MGKKSKGGFTLIELLAVIAILALILAITVPSVLGVIKTSTKRAFEIDSQMVLQKIMALKLKDVKFDETEMGIDSLSTYNLSDDNYSDLRMGIVDGDTYIVVVGKNKWDGFKACGTINHIITVDVSDMTSCEHLPGPKYNSSKGINRPVLATGMTPIKWDGANWINTTEDDTDWYNYTESNKHWANAKTADGSMWVWIPRYVYKISSGWHANTAGTIDIQFSINTDDTRKNTVTLVNTGKATDSNGTWTNHPAFTFGNIELTGIWVAKFEASGTANTVESKAGALSLRFMNASNMFVASRNMEANNRYGWGTTGKDFDTHMAKNVEWGAAAYLSQSKYGKNSEVWINNSSTFRTGCSGGEAAEDIYEGCENQYNTANGEQASTTGNIYGVYDMSGGAYEYTAAYINNGNPSLENNGSILIGSADKYKDVYVITAPDNGANNFQMSVNKKGDSIYETSTGLSSNAGWYGDYSIMPLTDAPWFVRGGDFGNVGGAGIFSFNKNNGIAGSLSSFRVIIAVGDGL